MDTAQLARNIAEGRGYSTMFVRPFSMYLVKQNNQGKPVTAENSGLGQPTRIRDDHPDLANAPVYPVMLAALMKVLPFEFPVPAKPKPFWSFSGQFYRYQPDFLISMFNQLLFFALILLVYFLVRRAFDGPTAILSAVLLFFTDLFWRFSVSGLSTMLLLLIFAGVAWCLVALEHEGREGTRSAMWVYLLAGGTGLLIGIGALTRYSFGWLILPALIFLVIFAGRYRLVVTPIVFMTFLSAPALGSSQL